MKRKIMLPRNIHELEPYIEQKLKEDPERSQVYVHEKIVWNLQHSSKKNIREHIESLGYPTSRAWDSDAVIVHPKGYEKPEPEAHSLRLFLGLMFFLFLLFMSFL